MMNINDTLPKPNRVAVQMANLTKLEQKIQESEAYLSELQGQQADIQSQIDQAYNDREKAVQKLEQTVQDKLNEASQALDAAQDMAAATQADRLELLKNIADLKTKQNQHAHNLKALQQAQTQLAQDQKDTIYYKHSLDQRESAIADTEKDIAGQLRDANIRTSNTTKIQQDALSNVKDLERLKQHCESLKVRMENKIKQAEETIAKLGSRWQQEGV